MKKAFVLVACLLLSVFFVNAQNNVIDKELQKILNQRSDDYIDINIMLKSQMPTDNLSFFYCKSDNKEVRREIIVNELKKFAEQSQKEVMSVIKAEERSSNVIDIKSHWLTNFINCKAKADVIYQLASHPDVACIAYNQELTVDSDAVDETKTRSAQGNSSVIAEHLTRIKADKAWDLGYTGKGVIVALLDSGINVEHNDLKDHLWNENGKYGYNALNKDQYPIDERGHGTHCAGIICGDGTSGKITGVAPDATLMSIKLYAVNSSLSVQQLITGIEFAVANNASILNISQGWIGVTNTTRETLRKTFKNLLDLGVVAAVAAGNDRNYLHYYPVPGNIRTPGDCPPPWLHPDQQANAGGLSSVISVGGVDYSSDEVMPASSKGPVTWQETSFNDYPYNPGIGLIRPDIIAPGHLVSSLNYETNDGYIIKSGTSMSAPCVAGVMALMLEKNPDLTPADLCRIIETTAVKLSDSKSNDTGSGLIDALAAVQEVNFDTDSPNINLYDFSRVLPAGSNLSFDLSFINNGRGTNPGNANVTISTNDTYTTIVEGSRTYGSMAADETAAATFVVNISTLVPDNHIIELTINGFNKTFNIKVKVDNELVAPRLTAHTNGTSVDLTWNATNNATSYNIYRNGELIANTTSTSYTDSGLDYGTLYAYTVTSKRGDLESERSLIARAQIMDNPDRPAPTNVKVKAEEAAEITWKNGNNSIGANIYRKDVNTNDETSIATDVNGASYTDNSWSSLADGVYQYGVANTYISYENIYEEGFEGTNSWTFYNEGWGSNATNTNWKIADKSTLGKTFTYCDGSKSAFFSNSANNDTYLSYLVSPEFDLTKYNSNAKLSFYYITPSWKGDVNTLKLMISTTSNTGPWTEELWTNNKTDASEWTKIEVDLSAYAGKKFYIAFLNIVGAGYCSGVDNIIISVEGNPESRIEWSDNVYKNINIFVNDGLWSNTDNWAAKRLPNANDSQVIIDANATIASGNITVNSLTINEGKSLTLNNGTTLTVNGDFTNTDVDAFIINDGAQVFQNNEDVSATFVMNISNPKEWSIDNKDGWQFIASPVKNAKTEDFDPMSSGYDLYKYDGTKVLEWRNHKYENTGEEEEPEESCNVIFTLKDSYGDGWYKDKLIVSYDETSTDLDFTENQNAKTKEYVLEIPKGSHVTVVYQAGTTYSYPAEESIVIAYENGREIYSLANMSNGCNFEFDVNCDLPPNKPIVRTKTIGETTIELTMLAFGADSYTIYKNGTLLEEGITTTTYTVEGLTANTEYCFSVVAVNKAGTSEATEICAKTKAANLKFVTVQIGEGENSTYSAPIYNYYSSKSISQTIYTATEIKTSAGTITSISFKNSKGNNNIRNIAVYLENTEKDYFTSTKDWETLSHCVYDSTFTFGTNDWAKIPLQIPFSYNGGNLVVCVIDKTGSSLNASEADYFYVYDIGQNSTDTRSIYANGSNINLENISENTGYFLRTYNGPYRAPQIELDLEIASERTVNLNGGFDKVNSFSSSGTELNNFEIAFQQGVGYLASYESEKTATFKGTLNHEKSYTFDVSYNTSGKDLVNFHLLGNPFSFNMNWNNVSTSNMINGYAVVNNEGGYDYHTSGEIKVGDGFFVKTDGANPSISYNARSRNDKKETSLNVIATGKDGKDNVIVRLEEEQEGFPKINNFNEDIALVYVSENDVPYGIYNYNDDVQEVELFFRAAHIGEYNIHIEPSGEFEYITLVDNVNGSETNMMTSSYSFTATPKENGKRFSLKFATGKGADVQENFVYQSGSELVINAEGTIQIIDMMGRIIYNNDVTCNNRIDISKFNKTAYIVRLINGNSIYTQKVVVY